MPRDKTLSHEKVKKAIKEEFLEKGFEDASVRSIGARAGMTSAGLYRHYEDKEAMFNAMVEPLIESIQDWTERHTSRKYNLLEDGVPDNELFGEMFIDMVREVILPRKDEFILLISRSGGTRYENFIHDYVEENQKQFLEAIRYLKEKGYQTVELGEDCYLGAKGALVNIEVQKNDNDDHEFRVYYNGASIIVNNTPRGTKKFRDIPRAVVIFISDFDVFGEGRMFYEVGKFTKGSMTP